MKKCIACLFGCLIYCGVFAQNINLDWAASMDSSLFSLRSMVTDDLNNLYTVGFFNGSIDFDPGPATFNLTSNGLFDIFIQKLDSNGNFIWAKSFGGHLSDKGTSICRDNLGNLYITGAFKDTVDFDPGPAIYNLSSQWGPDIFILKLDSAGNFVWARSIEGNTLSDYDTGNSITTDALGNLLITGYFSSTVDFDPGASTVNHTSLGLEDIFILKLSSNGNFIWVKTIGGINYDAGTTIDTDTLNNIFITGQFNDAVDFDPGIGIFTLISPPNKQSGFILKLLQNGSFLWAKSITFNYFGAITEATIGPSQNFYFTGMYTDTVDLDPGPGIYNVISNGDHDFFTVKLSNSGTFDWGVSSGGSDAEYTHDIAADQNENIYLTGVTFGYMDFDPGPNAFYLNSSATQHMFVQKLTKYGNFSHAFTTEGIGLSTSYDVCIDNSNSIYVGGYYSSTVDFDPNITVSNLSAPLNNSGFVARYSQCAGDISC